MDRYIYKKDNAQRAYTNIATIIEASGDNSSSSERLKRQNEAIKLFLCTTYGTKAKATMQATKLRNNRRNNRRTTDATTDTATDTGTHTATHTATVICAIALVYICSW